MAPQVNVPTDPKQRDRDVDNKLRLWAIYNAFQNGKLPSNKQIDVALTSFANQPKLKEPNSKLSDEGKHLVNDFRNVIEEAKRLILTKNHDQAIQEFIWNASHLADTGAPNASKPEAPISKEQMDAHAQQANQGLKTLGQLIITNGQFRKLLNDATILLRDIAGDAATRAAGRVNPTEEELSQIDRPAPDSTWHDAPNFSRDTLKQQVTEKVRSNKPVDRNDLQDAAGNATQAADPYGSRDPADTANRAAREGQTGSSQGIDAQRGLDTGKRELRERLDENIPEDQKQRAREQRERGRNYLSGKMPKERREQTIWRLKKMVVEIQGHRDYEQAIDTLLSLAEEYTGHGKNLAGSGLGAAKDAHQDSNLSNAEASLKVILERFANYTSADDLIDAINDIYRDADRDPELKNWFKSVNRYVRKCLKEQGFILQDDASREYNQLYDHGNFLLRNRYRDHTDRLMDEMRFLGDQITADPDNQRFANALQKLFNDLGNDENGKPTIKKHLIKDVTNIILPDIFEGIRYVPLPRIEYSDTMVDAVIENMVIESDNLMPNVVEIGNDSYYRYGRRSIKSTNKRQLMVSASQIQADLRDVSYYINRKKGFPSITDTGVADIFLGGDGFGFKLELSTADKKDRQNFFKIDKCEVHIKNMNIKLKQSKHKALFGLFKPLLLKVMRPAFTKALEAQIKQVFTDLDALAYRIYEEEKKIEAEVKENPDPENIQNIYSRYYTAAQRELTKRREQAQQTKAKVEARQPQARIAYTKEDSLPQLKDIDLPGGISTRATELKKQAATGDRWENDIFSIGSASPSFSLSHPVEITRKSPHAHRRAVRDRETASTGGQSRDSGYVPDAASGDFHVPTASSPTAGGFILNKGPSGGEYDRYNAQTQNAAGYGTVA